ncbi:MAG: IS66 family transposase zinc-finger binding domain-containing protein [Anaeromyxobacter sp.]
MPEEKKACPKCGGREFTTLGDGRETVIYELVPAMVERQLHVQEKCRCRCGETMRGQGPPLVALQRASRRRGRPRSSTRRASAPPSWPRSPSRSAPTRCRSTGRRRRTAASASRWTTRRWAISSTEPPRS